VKNSACWKMRVCCFTAARAIPSTTPVAIGVKALGRVMAACRHELEAPTPIRPPCLSALGHQPETLVWWF